MAGFFRDEILAGNVPSQPLPLGGEIHPCSCGGGLPAKSRQRRPDIRWIGVDLNTTGHAVVAAEPVSGKVILLGKVHAEPYRQSSRRCTKLYHEGKLWKISRYKSRERKMFKATLMMISRQIVSFAESMCSGIKLEKLFSGRHRHPCGERYPAGFSFGNSSFHALQQMVEKQAMKQGIPVRYVDPAYTSKRCSRCGASGRRLRKRFECSCCGAVIHADVNAAFNIASTSLYLDPPSSGYSMRPGKKIRRILKASDSIAKTAGLPQYPTLCGEI